MPVSWGSIGGCRCFANAHSVNLPTLSDDAYDDHKHRLMMSVTSSDIVGMSWKGWHCDLLQDNTESAKQQVNPLFMLNWFVH
jgi:hypothetical protein